MGRGNRIEKAARYGDHHRPAAVADERVYPQNFNVVLERTVRELNGELHFTGGSAAAETADCLQSQLRAADHHL
jgi:hypothetical protein